MAEVYQICIPHTHRDSFDYLAQDCTPCLGARVWVPFRTKMRLGLVLRKGQTLPAGVPLKNIHEVIDEQPLLTEELLTLCLWMGSYYQSPLSEIIAMALPKKYRLGLASLLPVCDYYQLKGSVDEAQKSLSKTARKQAELLTFLGTQPAPVSKKNLLQAGFQSTQIQALLKAKIITLSQQVLCPKPSNQILQPPLTLNPEQAMALVAITEHLNHYRCFLLQGVTGSGKTEVYLQTMAKILEQNKQILILVPEIGLTPQLLSRFTDRFHHPIAVIHSHLNETERQIAWQLAKESRAKIVIGTRSAVLTPMPDLGLIVIDEEHDSSLKQMEGVRYSARDTALMRAHLANIPIILGSATPSLESLHNCKQKKSTLLRLQHKALSNTPLHYQLVDLRSQTLQEGLSATTLSTIEKHLEQKNQVLVFINRRGFAPVLLCHSCGWMVDCLACDSHLTLHLSLGQMLCHHCGLHQKIPTLCPHCKRKEFLPLGAGTQRIYDCLNARFPSTKIVRIDRDEISKKNALHRCLDQIHQGETQLIIGTQMLAKGHHFPNLSLVVILDIDAGLYNQDFRAIEQLGQLVTQVSGRAGRAQQAGEVLIQTHLPHHPLLNLLIQQGYEEFAQALLESRQQAELPPFHFLAMLRAQGKIKNQVEQFLKDSKHQMQHHPLTLMGPAPAPLPRKANQYRMQLFIKSPSRKILKHSLLEWRSWLTKNPLAKGIRWSIDVDPINLT